jgi:sulfate transport system substrate-binding protein
MGLCPAPEQWRSGEAQEFVKALFKNVEVLDSGPWFDQHLRGTWDRRCADCLGKRSLLATNELGKDKFEIVTPSESILAEPTVSVDKVVDKKALARWRKRI